MFEEEDRELNLILPIVLGVAVVLSIATVLFAGLALPRMAAKPPLTSAPVSAPAAAAPAAAPAPATAASLRSIYFESGKAALADADRGYLTEDLAKALKAKQDMRIAITGYTDASGNLDQNLELAKQRAFAVRDVLFAAGITEAQVVLRKPETVTGSGDPREARRVEIYAAQ